MAAAALAAIVNQASAQVGAQTPISLDDLLHGEDFGTAVFSPSGDRIAFTRSVAIADHPGTDGFEDPSRVRERVFVVDADGGAPREIECPKGSYCSLSRWRPWSPDGGRMLLIEATKGRFNLAVWNAASGKVTSLPGRPDSSFAPFDWAGDHVVYAALSEKQRQRVSNLQMLEHLDEIWSAGWEEGRGLATVSSANPVFAPSEPPEGALMIANLASGKVAKLADGDFIMVTAAPDGKHVAALRLDESRPTALSWQGRRAELQIYRLTGDGAKLVRVFEKLDVQFQSLAWNASGNKLLVGGKAPEEEIGQSRLYVVDARTGESRAIALPRDSSLHDPRAGLGLSLLPIKWIGDNPAAVLARKGVASADAAKVGSYLEYGETAKVRFDLHVFARGSWENLTAFSKSSVNQFLAPDGKDFALVVADGSLWRVRRGSKAERLSTNTDPKIAAFAVDDRFAPPESAYYHARNEERVAVYAMVAGGAPERRVFDLRARSFGEAQARDGFLADSPDLRSTVYRIHDNWVTRLVLRNEQSAERSLGEANTELSARAVAPVERFTYNSGGKQLIGWVVKPPNAQPGQPLPAVVSVYGGTVWGAEPPSSAGPTIHMPQFSGQLLAAHGYAVIYPSTPLEPGATSDAMATLAQHVIAAVDALAGKGVVDPKRVGVLGQSFGGYSTAAILAARSDRFAAGIAMAGVYGWIHSYGMPSQAQLLTPDGRDQSLEIKVVEAGQIQLQKPFWEDPEPYIRNSPIFHVEKIDAPLLMLQGDLDFGVTGLAGAMRMYNALIRAGKKPALVRYWGEGHVFHSEWAIRDQWSRILTWFDAYLTAQRGH